MKLSRKSSSQNLKDSVKTSGCGCGAKPSSAADEYEIDETEIEVSK